MPCDENHTLHELALEAVLDAYATSGRSIVMLYLDVMCKFEPHAMAR